MLVHVADADAAAAAEDQGAEGLVIDRPGGGLREATSLPLLFRGESPDEARNAGADGWVLIAEHHHDEGSELEDRYARVLGLGLECVIDVRDEEELELVFERVDPEIVLLSPGRRRTTRRRSTGCSSCFRTCRQGSSRSRSWARRRGTRSCRSNGRASTPSSSPEATWPTSSVAAPPKSRLPRRS